MAHRGVIHCSGGLLRHARGRTVPHRLVIYRLAGALRAPPVSHRGMSCFVSGRAGSAVLHPGMVHRPPDVIHGSAAPCGVAPVIHRFTAGRARFAGARRRERAMAVCVPVTTECLAALLGLAERPRALARNGIVSPAAAQEHERSKYGRQGQIALGHRPASWLDGVAAAGFLSWGA
jgi:hypothetical protein